MLALPADCPSKPSCCAQGKEKVSGTFCAKHPKGRSGKRFLTPFPSPFPRSFPRARGRQLDSARRVAVHRLGAGYHQAGREPAVMERRCRCSTGSTASLRGLPLAPPPRCFLPPMPPDRKVSRMRVKTPDKKECSPIAELPPKRILRGSARLSPPRTPTPRCVVPLGGFTRADNFKHKGLRKLCQ